MKGIIAILGSLGAGAALMYLFDPNGGRRRRALIRDKAVGLSNDVRQTVGSTGRDLGNRARGLMHDVKSITPGGMSNTSENANT